MGDMFPLMNVGQISSSVLRVISKFSSIAPWPPSSNWVGVGSRWQVESALGYFNRIMIDFIFSQPRDFLLVYDRQYVLCLLYYRPVAPLGCRITYAKALFWSSVSTVLDGAFFSWLATFRSIILWNFDWILGVNFGPHESSLLPPSFSTRWLSMLPVE